MVDKYYIVSRNYTANDTGVKFYEIVDDQKTAYRKMDLIADEKLAKLRKNRKGISYDLVENSVDQTITIKRTNPDGTCEDCMKYKVVKFTEYLPTVNSSEFWIIKNVEIHHSLKSSNLRLDDWMGYLTTVKNLKNAILWIENTNNETF